LKTCAKLLRAKPIAKIYAGMIASKSDGSPPDKALRKARKAGQRIATS
jgi:hypothetical protein